MSVTSGDELGVHRVRRVGRRAGRPRPRRPAASGRRRTPAPRLSTFGQVMLTSITQHAGRAAQPVGQLGEVLDACRRRSTRPPGRPRSASHGRSSASNPSMPGPCRPIELSIPLGVSAIRGVARPDRGAQLIDLVTTAAERGRGRRTGPAPGRTAAQPEAVSTGFGTAAPPASSVRRSVIGRPTAGAAASPAHRVGADGVRRAACRRRRSAPGRRAKTGPSTQERTKRVTAVVADHRQHAGHADPDAAGHRLLDGDLRRRSRRSVACAATARSIPIGPQA